MKDEGTVTLADIMYEYLGRPKTLQEVEERMAEQLTPKERRLIEKLPLERVVKCGRQP